MRGEAGPPRCIGGQPTFPRAPALHSSFPPPTIVIPAPHFVTPAPHLVTVPPPNRHSANPPSRRPESRGAVRGEAGPPRCIGGQPTFPRAPRAPHFVMPAPTLVIPAKAGIQEGRRGVGHGDRSLNAAPPSFRRPISSFRRRPESRGAARGKAAPPRCIGGQPTFPRAPALHSSFRPPPSSFRRRPESRGAVGGAARPPRIDCL